MKRILPILFGLLTFFSAQAISRDYRNDSIRHVRDSLQRFDPDVLITKPIGRYDRGIINFRFIPKGSKLFGVTASYSNSVSDNSNMLLVLTDLDYSFKSMRVNPFAGYFIRDNMMIGVKFGYNNQHARIDNSALNVEDLDFSLANVAFSQRVYSSALFHRSYVGLDRGRRFGLFNETSLGIKTGDATFSRLQEGEPKVTESSITQLELGISPGIAVFIMQNISAEVSFGLIGFNYRHESQTVNNEKAGSFSSSGANFKINLLNINIGITVCL